MRSSQTSLFAPVRSANAQSASQPNPQAPLQASLTGSFVLPLAYFVRCQNYIWEIFRVVVYCSVIKVLCVVVQATALIYYHIFHRLSTSFLISFFRLSLATNQCPSDNFYRLSCLSIFVNNFFHLFSRNCAAAYQILPDFVASMRQL